MKMIIGSNFTLFLDSIAYFTVVNARSKNLNNQSNYILIAVLKGIHGPLQTDNPNVIVLSKPYESENIVLRIKSKLEQDINEGFSKIYMNEIQDYIEKSFPPYTYVNPNVNAEYNCNDERRQ